MGHAPSKTVALKATLTFEREGCRSSPLRVPTLTKLGVVVWARLLDQYRRVRESCVVDRRDSGTWLSAGIAWASRITTLALELTIPVLAGVGVDRWWGTSPVATISGAVLGFVLFMLHTLRLAKNLPDAPGGALSHSSDTPRADND
jgi:ATP synthase protein I